MNYLIAKNIWMVEIFNLHIGANFITGRQKAAAACHHHQQGQLNAFLSFKDFNMIFISGFTKVFIKWI